MTKVTGRRKAGPGIIHKAIGRDHRTGLAMVETYLPAGSTERTAAEIGVAIGGALLAAAVLGAGPAALAGAAGYMVYSETRHA